MSKTIPLPLKLFSLTPNDIDEPSVPKPAAAEISPVAFSSIIISISVFAVSSLS